MNQDFRDVILKQQEESGTEKLTRFCVPFQS